MIYLIHTSRHLYYPNKGGMWTSNSVHAKKYVNKPAMLKVLRKLEKENGGEIFYFETFEMVSKGSQTLTIFKRNQKISEIKKRNDNT